MKKTYSINFGFQTNDTVSINLIPSLFFEMVRRNELVPTLGNHNDECVMMYAVLKNIYFHTIIHTIPDYIKGNSEF